MKDVQKPEKVSLTSLIGRLREGRYVIPDFQREFEWKPKDILELVRSIFLDYYIGSLLLWKGKQENFEALACERIFGFGGEPDPTHIVLDGQQRLASMHYVFTAPNLPLPTRSNRFLYFIRVDRFMEESYDAAFEYDWTNRGEKLLQDRESQFENHMFPVSIVGQGGWELPNWVQDYERYWREKETVAQEVGDIKGARDAERRSADARSFGIHLKGITEEYQISYIELDRNLEIDKVCDIFTQINSRGVRLDVFDLVNALLKPKGIQLRRMWRDVKPLFEFVNAARMNVYLLQVMSILRQAYCSPKYLYYMLPGQEKKVRDEDGSLRTEVLVPNKADFEQRWNHAVNAVEAAIELLCHPQEFGAISSRFLPYDAIIPAFAALQSELGELPAPKQLDAQRKLHHWYWASVFTNRYSGSVESTTARDYLDVSAWFENEDNEPSLIGEFRERFRNLDLRRETRRGTSVYSGIFNLLVLNGARDWMKGAVPKFGDLDDHHIVPKKWGKRTLSGQERLIDTILNRTPLTAETNRNVIREQLPNEYLPVLIEANGEALVREILESHFISSIAFEILLRDPFTKEDFEEFLTERQRTLRDAIENLLIKERLDLPPTLRELDSKIESIELGLRRRIDTVLESEPTEIPSSVRLNIEGRLQSALKRNPALDSADYESVEGKLQYADLRELQNIILNKEIWHRFEDKFLNKETTGIRFRQLADLRNSIRHSRQVDEITQKEGEAAILWFEKVNKS